MITRILVSVFLLGFALNQRPAKAENVLRAGLGSDITCRDVMGPAGTQTYVHGLIVCDTLFAMDATVHPRLQMVDTQTLSLDPLTWTLWLRPRLLFHNGSNATAADVARMDVDDENTFTFHLKRTYPVEQALANSGSGLPVIMREQEAGAGPFYRDTRIIGSEPFPSIA